MKALLAFEEEQRLYFEAIATAIRSFRPNVEVGIADSDGLEAEVERFAPQLIISSFPLPENPVRERLLGWIELSPESTRPWKFRVGEQHWERTNPPLREILSVIDESSRL